MDTEAGWDYDCPQYVDFSTTDSLLADDKLESYFDFDHENGVPVRYSFDDGKRTPVASVKRVTRSQSSASLGTPVSGKAKTPGSVMRSKSLRGMKENITPVLNGVKPTPSKKNLNASKKTDSIIDTADPSRLQSDTSEHIKTEVTPKATPVLQDVTDASGSQRVTRSKTPQAPNNVIAKTEVPKNVCTSLEEWKKKTAKQTNQSHERDTQNKTRQTETNNNNKRQHRSIDRGETLPKKSKTTDAERGATPGKKGNSALRRSCSVRVRPTSGDRQKAHVRGYSGDRALRARTGSASSDKSDPRPASGDRQKTHVRGYSSDRAMRARTGSASSDKSDHKPILKSQVKDALTIPDTPEMLKRKPVKLTNQPSVKSTEELNMEKIAYYRQMLAEKRKLAEDSYKKAMTSKGPAPLKQTKELTHPVEMRFETDKRLKRHPMETRQDEEVKDFTKTLRSERHKSPGPAKVKNHLTKPQPFPFTQTKRRKVGDTEEKQEEYEPMAVKVKAFTATPDRFRSRPRDKGPQTRGRSKSPPGVTIPKTPSFETRSRSRPVTAPSRQELEEKEIEEIQKKQFKARPVNTKIMSNPNTGIRKVPSKPVTVPHEFHLSSYQRAHERDKEGADKHEFHAQPLNKRILEGTVGVQEAKKLPLTVPESPAFALKHRARIPIEIPKEEEKQVRRSRTVPHYGIPFRPQLRPKITDPEPFTFDERDRARAAKKSQKIEQVYEDEKMEEKHIIKAHSIPHTGIPFVPKLSPKTTTVEPFTFDERDKLNSERKQQKIKDIIAKEKKAREFYANPLPDLQNVNLPPKKPRPATTVEPFNLDTDVRGSKKAEEWSHKIEDELRQQKEQMKFKARSTHVLEQEPFIPEKPHKATSDISEFELSTAKRAVQREAFEMLKKSRQDEKDDYLHQETLRKESEEREEYERQRREAVHKAQPVKQYKPVLLKRSDKPLTEPMTPDFKTDTRLRTRAQQLNGSSSSVNSSK